MLSGGGVASDYSLWYVTCGYDTGSARDIESGVYSGCRSYCWLA